VRGPGLSTAYFWAINRNQDATFYYDWFSRAGYAVGSEYRVVTQPGSQGDARFYMLDEQAQFAEDGSIVRPASRSYEVRGTLNQRLSRTFRLIGQVNYFSDAATQQLYEQNLYDFSRRDRYLGATVTGTVRRVRISAAVDNRDVYTDLNAAQRYGRLPQVKFWFSEQPLGRSKIYLGGNAEVAYLVSRPDVNNPATDRSLWRFDGAPTLRAPLSNLSFLSVTTSASWRITRWLESRNLGTGETQPIPLTRSLIDLRADMVGPVLSKVYQSPDSGYAEVKHLIEPVSVAVTVRPVCRSRRNDHVSRSAATTVNYSLTTRLLAKLRGGAANQLLSREWPELLQQCLATAFDSQYQSATVGGFSPIQFSAQVMPPTN
jgi:hypothetical protein